MTVGLVLASAILASRESDVAALDRQMLLVNGRLHNQVESVGDELDLMADGYANTIEVLRSNHEAEAFDAERFTNIITSIFKYDAAFIVWSDGELALQRDANTIDQYEWIKPLVMPVLKRSVQSLEAERSGDAGVGPGKTVELMRLQGRPSVAGAVPIGNDLGQSAQGRRLFLIAYRYLDGPALDALSHEQGLSGVRFARSSDPEADEVTFQIEATASREPIGFIIWTPDLPGSRVVVGLIPALTVSALIIAGLVGALVLLLRKSWSDLRASEQKARHRSLHDILTDLPNRALFGRRLEDCLNGPGRAHAVVALIDLDKFKAVNDTLGHAAGDEIIRLVAGRITALLGPDDMLARLGGDEFALLLANPQGSADYHALGERIVGELARPFILLDGKEQAQIGCSIGFTTISAPALTASDVLHRADLALYTAKSSGRGRWVDYAATMDSSAKSREELKADLAAFFDSVGQVPSATPPGRRLHGIEVFYQTIHSAGRDNAVSGVEALVRWRHEDHGLLTPDRFIALAEDSGLIHRLGRFVLREACVAATAWPEQVMLAVNVSPTQLRRADFAAEVLDILAQTGLPPARLELELTETALMSGDEAMVQQTIARLRLAGIKIALDDFGTGYSSLSHLVQFGIDRIKIDRSFVRLLGMRADGAAIVSAVVALSHSLGLATTAEGVETAGQRDFLIAAGCTDLQGYLFSRPNPAPAIDIEARKQALA